MPEILTSRESGFAQGRPLADPQMYVTVFERGLDHIIQPWCIVALN